MEIEVRIPLFGKQKISLREESEKLYDLLKEKKEIDRLETEVMHLGIIHELGETPSFGRWVHIQTMLFLIEEIRKSIDSNPKIREQLGFKFGTKVKLANGIEFSSAEELLKCWAMLYSIGHMVGTFTTEHALLKHILLHKKIHKNYLKKKIKDNLILQEANYIIDNELIFRIFKIITFLKVVYTIKDAKYIELAKLNISEDRYLKSFGNYSQQSKMKKLINLFKTIRLLSFIILDGYFSQNCVTVNYYFFLLNLEKLLIAPNPYYTLLNKLNAFYTGILYQSPENMYLHHKISQDIKKKFEEKVRNNPAKKIPELWKSILSNKIDKKLSSIIRNAIKKIGTKKPYHFGRVVIKRIETPVSKERKLFNGKIEGGIIYNLSNNSYEIDIYSSPRPSLDEICEITRIVKVLYDELEQIKYYKKAKPRGHNTYLLHLIFNYVKKTFDKTTKDIVELLLSKEKPRVTFCCEKRKSDFYAFLFTKDIKDLLYAKISSLEVSPIFTIDHSTKKEISTSKKILRDIVRKMADNCIFIVCPTIVARKDNQEKAESDFSLICINPNEKTIDLYFAEIKKALGNKRIDVEQIEKYLIYFLGIDSEKKAKKLAKKLKNNKCRRFTKKLDDSRKIDAKMRKNAVIFHKRIQLINN